MKISKIIGREILDSRGNPTVEAEVTLEDGSLGRGAVPSGASVGSHEAHELRDNDPARYEGLGVQKAVANVNERIAHDLVGLHVDDQRSLDQRLIKLDGTPNKEHLGANAMLAVSIAAIKAAASSAHQPLFRYLGGNSANLLPVPLMNIINGGAHAVDSTDFQEFMIVPSGAETYTQAVQMCLEVYHELRSLIAASGLSTNVGDEGGFGLPNAHNEDALKMIVQAIEKAEYRPGRDMWIALDVAADEFHEGNVYHLKKENKSLTSPQMREYVTDLIARYPIFSVEDPFYEDDWTEYQTFTTEQGQKVQIVGDDLFVTNMDRLQQGITQHCANAILVKPNQIGTVTETIDTVNLAKQNGFATVISHRSGETVDAFIADLAVALGAGQIKTGSPARGERTAKYNQLLRIEEMLGTAARYPSLI